MDTTPTDLQKLAEQLSELPPLAGSAVVVQVEGLAPQSEPLSHLVNTAGDRERLLKVGVVKVQLLRLAMKGLNATDAAKVLGIQKEAARAYYRDPEFKKEVLRKVDQAFEGVDAAYLDKRKNLHEMLEEQAYKSCQDLISMLDNPDLHSSLRVKINQDFLNRHEDSKPLAGHSYKVVPAELKHAATVAREMDDVIPINRRVG